MKTLGLSRFEQQTTWGTCGLDSALEEVVWQQRKERYFSLAKFANLIILISPRAIILAMTYGSSRPKYFHPG